MFSIKFIFHQELEVGSLAKMVIFPFYVSSKCQAELFVTLERSILHYQRVRQTEQFDLSRVIQKIISRPCIPDLFLA